MIWGRINTDKLSYYENSQAHKHYIWRSKSVVNQQKLSHRFSGSYRFCSLSYCTVKGHYILWSKCKVLLFIISSTLPTAIANV